MLGCLLVCALSTGSAPAAPVIKWSSPRLVDRALPLGHTAALSGVSCPSTSLCVAVGDNVFTSTNPGGSGWKAAPLPAPASAVSCPSTQLCVAAADGQVLWSSNASAGPWNSVPVDAGRQLTSISCPSTQLCVAADNSGDVITSTDPTGGAGAWSATQIAASNAGADMYVSCPSEQLCVAVDGVLVLSTTDPAGGTSAWSSAQVEQQDPATLQTPTLTGVVCPSLSLCVAIDNLGNVLTSTNPAGGAGTWRVVNVDGSTPLSGVACASASLCLIADQLGNVLSSSAPAGNDTAWSAPAIAASNQECSIRRSCHGGFPPLTVYPRPVLACPSTSLCVMVDQFGVVTTATNPSASAGTWKPFKVDTVHVALRGVSCVSTALCIALDGDGNVFSSTDPTGGSSTWSLANVEPSSQPPARPTITATAISCVTGPLCAVVDDRGQVITSTNPTGGSSAWTLAAVAPVGLSGVSCASASSCAAIGADWIASSSNPTGGAAAWHTFELPGDFLEAVSCPSASLCVVTGTNHSGGSIVATSSDPTGGAAAWKVVGVGPGPTGFLTSLSCPSSSLCVAAGVSDLLISSDPTGGAGAWRRVTVLHGDAAFASVACPSTHLCLALSGAGISFSSNPAGGARTWQTVPVVGPGDTLACPSTTLCVSTSGRSVVTSTTPTTSPTSVWQQTAIDGASAIQSLSCPSLTLCVGFDDGVHVLSARNPLHNRATWKQTYLATLDAQTSGSLTCTAGPLCVIFDTLHVCGKPCFLQGAVTSSTNPAGEAGAWKSVTTGSRLMVAGRCPSRSLCVGLDGAGNVLTSSHPTGDANTWRTTAVGLGKPSDISCPTASFCAAAGTSLEIATSTRPTAGRAAWHLRSLAQGSAPSAPPPAISCPSSGFCALVSGNSVLTSTDPAGKTAWKRVQLNLPAPLTRVSCPSTVMCVATDQGGDVLVSNNPTGGRSAWTLTTVDRGNVLTALACPAGGACIAGDSTGHILVGTATGGVARKQALAALGTVVHSCSLQRFITILQRGGCPAQLVSPGAGVITITWLDSHGATIAVGTANAPASGPLTVHIRLTKAGRRLLGGAVREVSLRTLATFEDLAGHRYAARGSIVLIP